MVGGARHPHTLSRPRAPRAESRHFKCRAPRSSEQATDGSGLAALLSVARALYDVQHAPVEAHLVEAGSSRLCSDPACKRLSHGVSAPCTHNYSAQRCVTRLAPFRRSIPLHALASTQFENLSQLRPASLLRWTNKIRSRSTQPTPLRPSGVRIPGPTLVCLCVDETFFPPAIELYGGLRISLQIPGHPLYPGRCHLGRFGHLLCLDPGCRGAPGQNTSIWQCNSKRFGAFRGRGISFIHPS